MPLNQNLCQFGFRAFLADGVPNELTQFHTSIF